MCKCCKRSQNVWTAVSPQNIIKSLQPMWLCVNCMFSVSPWAPIPATTRWKRPLLACCSCVLAWCTITRKLISCYFFNNGLLLKCQRHCSAVFPSIMMFYLLEFSLTLESHTDLSHCVAPARSHCAFLYFWDESFRVCVLFFESVNEMVGLESETKQKDKNSVRIKSCFFLLCISSPGIVTFCQSNPDVSFWKGDHYCHFHCLFAPYLSHALSWYEVIKMTSDNCVLLFCFCLSCLARYKNRTSVA